MRDHRPTSTNDLLNNTKLQTIHKHAGDITTLNGLVRQILPAHLHSLVRVANFRHNHLVVETASAAIKMKVSYDRLNILNHLRQNGFSALIGLDITINPDIYKNAPPEPQKRQNPISKTAADMLTMVADNAPPKLKKRLEALAKLAEK